MFTVRKSENNQTILIRHATESELYKYEQHRLSNCRNRPKIEFIRAADKKFKVASINNKPCTEDCQVIAVKL